MAHEFVADQVHLGNDANDIEMDTPGKQEIPELHHLIQRRCACADSKHRYKMIKPILANNMTRRAGQNITRS
jgi:hypothetical protein